MKKFMTIWITVAVLLVMSVMAGQANATIVTVSGPNSSMGTPPQIIAPPTDVLDDIVVNTGMQGFNEAQGVLTTVAYGIDGGGTIPAGTLVNSHMIFFNALVEEEPPPEETHLGVTWTFADPILGVMSDPDGNLEAASTPELGAPTTNYPAAPFANRGLELENDGYLVSGNKITVDMSIIAPGDWIRVVTEVPEPATVALLGLGALSLLRRKRSV